MTTDILKYFPLNTKEERGGLFETPVSQREISDRPKKSEHGVSYTKFAESFDIVYGPMKMVSLFTMFHRDCYQYACVLLKNNPNFRCYELRRDNFYNSTVHCFAVKELPDGRTMFFDARGYTDNALEFFDDFNFGKTAKVLDITDDCRKETHIPFKAWMQEAYEDIFENCPYVEELENDKEIDI